ncbi:MAG: cytochrome c3 family protein [Desulfobacteraceae bacterium]
MTSKKHRMIIYGVAAHLLLIAIVCYAAFPVEKPENPIRLMYQTKAGKVLFDHQTHTGPEGYALDCFDCHHHPPDDEESLMACGKCHVPNLEEGVHPESCMECHDEGDIEDSEYPKRSDAFHQQCMQCHEQYGKGPQPGSDNCSKCHVI